MSVTSYDWIDRNAATTIDMVIAWAEINSGSRNVPGLQRMAGVLEAEMRSLGVAVEVLNLPAYEEIQDDGTTRILSTGPVLRAVCRPEAARSVLLNGHYDTVFDADHAFQKCSRKNGILRGPGVADMKGGLAVLFAALRIFESAAGRERLGWEVLLTPDEELGSPASAKLLEEAARAGRHSAGLIFEPALPGGLLASQRMGTANYTVFVRGKATHSGRDFKKGRNAIVALSRILPDLHAINETLPDGIVNIGRVRGGGPLNMVPDFASCRINVRGKTGETLAGINRCIKNIVTDSGLIDGCVFELRGGIVRPPKPMTKKVEQMLKTFRECGRELGIDLAWKGTGGASDGNNLLAAGLPTIDNLGVRGGGIHSGDEFMEIGSLPERAKLSANFLLKLARGEVLADPGK